MKRNSFRSFAKRYLGEDISYERKITIVFILSIIFAAAGAVATYAFQDIPVLIQLPTYAALIACAIILVKYKSDNFRPLIVTLCLIMFLYLPFAFFTTGGLDGPTLVFFVAGIFMLGYILKGKAKVIILAALVALYTALIFIGAYLPHYIYESAFIRGFDFALTYAVISLMAIMITTIIVIAIQAEEKKTKRLMEELKNKNQELEMLAIIDPLTGCYNRRFLYDSCQGMVEEYSSGHIPFSLMMIDIDHFKKINDAYGHDAGDDILRVLSNTIRQTIRLHDLFIRYGGEEFIVVLPDCDEAIGREIAERIRKNIEECKTRDNIRFTVSIGFALLKEDDDLDTLINRADANMYMAKNKGRNQVV